MKQHPDKTCDNNCSMQHRIPVSTKVRAVFHQPWVPQHNRYAGGLKDIKCNILTVFAQDGVSWVKMILLKSMAIDFFLERRGGAQHRGIRKRGDAHQYSPLYWQPLAFKDKLQQNDQNCHNRSKVVH